ncbi:MAG: DUF3820 family protein [Bacteriovoracaceae bacterium]|nr:DUF3820 family protein [Bacteriovoracaceae bacterium]
MYSLTPNSEELYKLIDTRMPFGKYAGIALIDLPEEYLVWFESKGFPEGAIGGLLAQVYEIKINGLEFLFGPLRKNRP